MNYGFHTHLHEMPPPRDFDEALDQVLLLKDALREAVAVDDIGISFAHLSKTQRLFLSALYSAKRPVSVSYLADIRKAWDANPSTNIENVVRVQIYNLREALPEGAIATIYGSGYALTISGRRFVAQEIARNSL